MLLVHLYVGYITRLIKAVYGERQVHILQNSSLQVSVVYIIILAVWLNFFPKMNSGLLI